jgi:hypothetical protein
LAVSGSPTPGPGWDSATRLSRAATSASLLSVEVCSQVSEVPCGQINRRVRRQVGCPSRTEFERPGNERRSEALGVGRAQVSQMRRDHHHLAALEPEKVRRRTIHLGIGLVAATSSAPSMQSHGRPACFARFIISAMLPFDSGAMMNLGKTSIATSRLPAQFGKFIRRNKR